MVRKNYLFCHNDDSISQSAQIGSMLKVGTYAINVLSLQAAAVARNRALTSCELTFYLSDLFGTSIFL